MFASMLKELVDSSSAATAETLLRHTAFTRNAEATLNTSMDAIDDCSKQTFNGSTDFVKELQQTSATGCAQMAAGSSGIEASRAGAFIVTANISNSVGEKKAFLEDTVGSLQTDVAVAIDKACIKVDSTSEQASTILSNVNDAAAKMNKSASASLASFVHTLSNEGDRISEVLDTHFSGLAASVTEQQTAIHACNRSVQTFEDDMSGSYLQRTGTTPEKVRYSSMAPFRKTENHRSIKRKIVHDITQNPKKYCYEFAIADAKDQISALGLSSNAAEDDDDVCNEIINAVEQQPVASSLSSNSGEMLVIDSSVDLLQADSENVNSSNVNAGARSSTSSTTTAGNSKLPRSSSRNAGKAANGAASEGAVAPAAGITMTKRSSSRTGRTNSFSVIDESACIEGI
jgi:hypothetical protein